MKLSLNWLKQNYKIFFIIFLVSLVIPFSISMAEPFAQKHAGKIFLQVESRGEAWYISPTDSQRHYLKDGQTAYTIMRDLGLGISNNDLNKIPVGFLNENFNGLDTDGDSLSDLIEESLGTDSLKKDTDGDGYGDYNEILLGFNPLGAEKTSFDNNLVNRLKGRILLQVENKGQAWYVNPQDGKRYYMENGDSAYSVMRYLGVGITNVDLEKIVTANAKANDTDSDGLTNDEETQYGTDPNKADTDGDGYSDLSELQNGYNPSGDSKQSYTQLAENDVYKKNICQTTDGTWHVNDEYFGNYCDCSSKSFVTYTIFGGQVGCQPIAEPSEKKECEDSTPVNQCSATKPQYCSYNLFTIEGQSEYILSDNCEECGCPEGLTCDSEGFGRCYDPNIADEGSYIFTENDFVSVGFSVNNFAQETIEKVVNNQKFNYYSTNLEDDNGNILDIDVANTLVATQEYDGAIQFFELIQDEIVAENEYGDRSNRYLSKNESGDFNREFLFIQKGNWIFSYYYLIEDRDKILLLVELSFNRM